MLDGALGSADVFGVRDGVAVELRQIVPSGLLVRFVDGTRPGRASIVAHSFLWMLTSRGAVEEAMLVGPGVQPLRFRDGRIQPSDTSELRTRHGRLNRRGV